MPILPSEPQIYPDDLWESDVVARIGAEDGPAGHRWYCLHIKPRQEKAAARDLRTWALPHYLPQVSQESRTPAGRVIRSVQPLFPGYLFLAGDDGDRVRALQTRRLVRVLEVEDQPGLTRDLRQIHTMIGSGLLVRPEPSHPVGSRIRILSGPLQGVVGMVARREKRDQFIATVSLLGCGASVDLEDWQVEAVREGDAA